MVTKKFTKITGGNNTAENIWAKNFKKKRIRPIIRKTVVKFTNIHVPLLISSGINGKL